MVYTSEKLVKPNAAKSAGAPPAAKPIGRAAKSAGAPPAAHPIGSAGAPPAADPMGKPAAALTSLVSRAPPAADPIGKPAEALTSLVSQSQHVPSSSGLAVKVSVHPSAATPPPAQGPKPGRTAKADIAKRPAASEASTRRPNKRVRSKRTVDDDGSVTEGCDLEEEGEGPGPPLTAGEEPPISEGACVVVRDLRSATDLNDQFGLVLAKDSEPCDRWTIRMLALDRTVNIKRTNLTVMSYKHESVKAWVCHLVQEITMDEKRTIRVHGTSAGNRSPIIRVTMLQDGKPRMIASVSTQGGPFAAHAFMVGLNLAYQICGGELDMDDKVAINAARDELVSVAKADA